MPHVQNWFYLIQKMKKKKNSIWKNEKDELGFEEEEEEEEEEESGLRPIRPPTTVRPTITNLFQNINQIKLKPLFKS